MSIIRGCIYHQTDLLKDIQSNFLKGNLDSQSHLSVPKDSDETKQQPD